MITLDQKVRVHPDVVDTRISDDEIALLQLESKNYFSLNTTAVRIWESLKEGMSLRDACRRLQDEFDVATEQAESSVIELVDELARQGLVEVD
ncbi:MAG: PqqD family protein [Gammaproteobacteria bacterium]|nr:PqqD family protein [Gammaproteobacteria bacterium]